MVFVLSQMYFPVSFRESDQLELLWIAVLVLQPFSVWDSQTGLRCYATYCSLTPGPVAFSWPEGTIVRGPRGPDSGPGHSHSIRTSLKKFIYPITLKWTPDRWAVAPWRNRWSRGCEAVEVRDDVGSSGKYVTRSSSNLWMFHSLEWTHVNILFMYVIHFIINSCNSSAAWLCYNPNILLFSTATFLPW